MVFPKSKSSGDMPTGSMKMMFYPTERIAYQLINEFNSIIDKINRIVKDGIMFEMPNIANDIAKMNITVFIKMFTPGPLKVMKPLKPQAHLTLVKSDDFGFLKKQFPLFLAKIINSSYIWVGQLLFGEGWGTGCH